MLKIGIIVGSTRPGRKAAAVAEWVFNYAGAAAKQLDRASRYVLGGQRQPAQGE